MKTTNHGTWSAYTPDPLPSGFPKGTLFAKSDASGLDWYVALYGKEPLFGKNSVKITATKEPDGSWRTQACNTDATKVFPLDQLLIEVTGYTGSDPQADFGQKRYDETANEIADFLAPAPPVPTSATKLGLRRVFVEMEIWDQVKVLIGANSDTQEEWDLATEIKRADPLVRGLIVALKLSPADVDHILIRARELVS